MVAHIMAVGKSTLPQQLSEYCTREVRIFPTAILQQLKTLVAHVGILDYLFYISKTKPKNKLLWVKVPKMYSLPGAIKENIHALTRQGRQLFL